MERVITIIGNLAALVGILFCLVSGVARATGSYHARRVCGDHIVSGGYRADGAGLSV